MIVIKKIFYCFIVVVLFTTHAAKAQQLSVSDPSEFNEEVEDTIGNKVKRTILWKKCGLFLSFS